MLISSEDIALIGLLIFLEGILSIDNALVLAMMAKHLPPKLQKRALTYGLVGAVVFRFICIGIATQLMAWRWVKFVGGGYLIFIAAKHFLANKHDDPSKEKRQPPGFWKTVLFIELMDIAFAVDSILAAVALTQKVWIVFTGGVLGVILMRFAATAFIRILNRFPGFETTAYLLVFVIGVKVILEGLEIHGLNFHSASSPAFWCFWGTMAACIALGFRKKKPNHSMK